LWFRCIYGKKTFNRVVVKVQNLIGAIVQHNVQSAGTLLISILMDFTQAIFYAASGWQKFMIAMGLGVFGGAGVITGGIADAAITLVGAIQGVMDITTFIGQSVTQFNNLYPNG
jgi:hypothetical protein